MFYISPLKKEGLVFGPRNPELDTSSLEGRRVGAQNWILFSEVVLQSQLNESRVLMASFGLFYSIRFFNHPKHIKVLLQAFNNGPAGEQSIVKAGSVNSLFGS